MGKFRERVGVPGAFRGGEESGAVEGRGLFQGASGCGPPVCRGGERGGSGGSRDGIQREFPEGEGRGVCAGKGTSGRGKWNQPSDVETESTGRLRRGDERDRGERG